MNKHRNVLYAVVFILLVLQITSFVSLSSHVSKLRSELEKAETNITSLTGIIESYNEQNQRNFNEIAKIVSQQAKAQASFREEITYLKSQEGDFSGVIEDAVKGVVSIGTDKSVATGFVVNSSGFIVTNLHVISGARGINVLTYDRKVVPASFVGADTIRDIALLKIEGTYEEIELADSNEVQAGRQVIAIGNPLGLSFSVTEGIVSAVDRVGPSGFEEYIQTDVSLNPGNSGGPLIDTTGKVVGINNFKIGGAESLGFALESNSMKRSINLIANQTIIQ